MTEISDVNPLPPGWDAKYDSRTGRRYFINYFTRNTSLEDPRANHKQSEYIPMQDFGTRPSPLIGGRSIGPPTMGAPALQYQQQKNAAAETTLEQSVAKISAMFPTVGETHIKTLLIKYLKSVFPVVEETLLLDTLCNSDNNVHRATEQLMTMGFNKRDTPPPRVSLTKKTDHSTPPPRTSTPPPRMRTVEEKQSMKERLQKKNPDIPERVVSIALDSVDYDEEKAAQILDMMQEDDKRRTETTLKIISEPKEVEVKAVPIDRPHIPVQIPNSNPAPPKTIQTTNNNNNHRRCKGKKESPKINKEFSPSETKYRSQLLTKPCGANPSLANGPNVDILLPDYATWTGPNQELVQGPDRSLLGSMGRPKPRGPDLSLRKGPFKGLAKGSIYSRLVPSSNSSGQTEPKAK